MKLSNNQLSISFMLAILLCNFFIITNFLSLKFFVGLFYILVIPGSLLACLFRVKPQSKFTLINLVIGMSVSFVMIVGLLMNVVFPQLKIIYPLTQNYLYPSFFILLVIGVGLNFIKNKSVKYKLIIGRLSYLDIFCYIIILVFLGLSYAGPTLLNNTGINFLVVLLLCAMSIYTIVVIVLRNRLSLSIFPASIYVMGLSLLLMLSLRGNSINGWDINEELKVFRYTNSGYWDYKIQHAYNSCLSITILPTIISKFTNIDDVYIFKFVYQLIFSFVPVSLYFIYKKYTDNVTSYLSAFYFVSQTLFIQPMTALMRQEIGFYFFSLMLLVIFEPSLKRVHKSLFLLFGMSLIVSHYSTNYISLLMLFGAYIMSNVVILIIRKFTSEDMNLKENFLSILNLRILMILVISTIFWNVIFTNTANNVHDVVTSTIHSFSNFFNKDYKSGEAGNYFSIVSNKRYNLEKELSLYYESTKLNYQNYSSYQSFSGYDPIVLAEEQVSPRIFSHYSQYIMKLIMIYKSLTKYLFIPGFIFLIIKLFKSKFDLLFLNLLLISSCSLIVIVMLPTISLYYNVDRLYMQLMFFLSMTVTVGLSYSLKYFKFPRFYEVTAIIFVLYFLFNYRLDSQIIGGEAFMHLYNFGSDYDKFYTYKGEVASGRWLEKYANDKVVYADSLAELRLQGFTTIRLINNDIFPTQIGQHDYLYTSVTNFVKTRTTQRIKGNNITFTFPTHYFKNNKGLIYNNGKSGIFK